MAAIVPRTAPEGTYPPAGQLRKSRPRLSFAPRAGQRLAGSCVVASDGAVAMKHLPRILAISFLGTLVAWQSRAYTLAVGTNAFDVVFGDTGVPTGVANRIVQDIALCRLPWTNSAVCLEPFDGHVGYIYQGNVVAGPYCFREPRFPRNLVTNAAGRTSLLVPSSLSGKYAEAFQFEDLHTNEVQQARLFIARLQSPDFPETPSNQVRDIVLHPGMTETQYIQAASDIIGDLQHQQFFQPSILGFWQSAKGPTIGSGTNLFMVIPCSLKPPRALRPSFEVMPAIWHDSKWKMWPME